MVNWNLSNLLHIRPHISDIYFKIFSKYFEKFAAEIERIHHAKPSSNVFLLTFFVFPFLSLPSPTQGTSFREWQNDLRLKSDPEVNCTKTLVKARLQQTRLLKAMVSKIWTQHTNLQHLNITIIKKINNTEYSELEGNPKDHPFQLCSAWPICGSNLRPQYYSLHAPTNYILTFN